MEEHKNLMGEIDAIIQNSGKKRLDSEVDHFLEIFIDKTKSDVEKLVGEYFIIERKKFLDGSFEDEPIDKHAFIVNEKNEFIIEKYDKENGLTRELLKMLKDIAVGIKNVAGESKMVFHLTGPGFQCNRKEILIICEPSTNKAVKDTINEMLFSGKANYHIDINMWSDDPSSNKKKQYQWAILELERRISNGESVIVSGSFQNWYEFMPIAVVSSMYNNNIIIGRTAGKRLSIGNVLDINQVIENFLANNHVLRQFYDDPYSALDHFKQVDNTINSLVIFPSVLHDFLSR